MLQTIDVGERSLASFRGIAPDTLLDELDRAAQDLRGLRVLHINATPYGGGVSELLRSLVPLLNDLGLVADWKVIGGHNPFFAATKAMHNGLQGAARPLSAAEQQTYIETSEANAKLLQEEYDVVFAHDPQPAGMLHFRGKGASRWVWRCHIDTAQPNPQVWAFLREYLTEYDAGVFTMAEFVPPDLPIAHVEIIPPAIDPLSPKNMPLPDLVARQVLSWIGIRLDRPLVTQVARFDPWKDPLGVIAAYRLAREMVPQLQLGLVGSMALDDPEGWEVYAQIQKEAADDPLIHVFTNLTGVGNVEVNAFQRLSDVIVQKSIREGFGLVVSEALWKGTPVVAGRAGGIPLQMGDGEGGILVESVESCAEAIVSLLGDPARAGTLAEAGRQRVREHFLLPRQVLNHVMLMRELMQEHPLPPAERAPTLRDPVCGMVLHGAGVVSTPYQAHTVRFCSEGCRRRFLDAPDKYGRSVGRNG